MDTTYSQGERLLPTDKDNDGNPTTLREGQGATVRLQTAGRAPIGVGVVDPRGRASCLYEGYIYFERNRDAI
jgi:hypothetical protein